MKELRKLQVKFNNNEEGVPKRPVADLSTLPQLQEVTLSSGWMEDKGPSSLNCHFIGRSKSASTLIIEAEIPPCSGEGVDLYGNQRFSPLRATLDCFRCLRHLILCNIGNQSLQQVELPLLETLEAYWCTPKTLPGVKVPLLTNLSIAVAMEPSWDLAWEFIGLLDSVNRIVIRLEWNFNSILELEPLNIDHIYRTLKKKPREACLVVGDVTGPGESIEWLRYRRRQRPNGATFGSDRDEKVAKSHKRERLRALRKLNLINIFRDSPELGYGW